MEYRTLGGSGVQVSTLCLGAMMYGPAGNKDESECAAMTHKALDAALEDPDLRLTDDVLDRIDELVPPGKDLNPDDAFYIPPPSPTPL